MKKTADIPNNVSTTAKITGGRPISNTLEFVGDEDWIAVKFTAGTTYTIKLNGSGTNALADPYLELRDSEGNLIAADDDSGVGRDSLLVFTATVGGTYYLDVCSFGGQHAGDYTVAVELGDIRTDSPLDSINVTDMTWDPLGEPDTVEIYFAAADEFVGSLGWTGFEQQQAVSALAEFSKAINVTYVQTTDIANADLILDKQTEVGAAGFFTLTDDGVGMAVFESFFDPTWADSLQQGGFGYSTLLHEFGHFMGLGHTHDPGLDDGVLRGVTFSSDLGDFDLNQGIYSMMSYNLGWATGPQEAPTSFSYGKAGGLMAFDIAVLQYKYGANTTYNSGDDIYELPTINQVGTFYSCLWDTGGNDTISAENASVASVIDLNDATLLYELGGGGFVSFVSEIHGGFTIANGVTIENAIGGSGDDLLIGNEAANMLVGGDGLDRLEGGAGDDTMFGDFGNDVLVGGGGEDQLFGGADADRFIFSDEIARDTVNDYLDEMDLLDMREQTGVKNFHQLRFTQEADGVVVDYKTGSVLLLGVTKADIDAGDLLF